MDSLAKLLGLAAVSMVAAGCASSSKNIEAAYVSPTPYEMLTCDQLAKEGARVSIEAAAAAEGQNKKRTKDAVVTTVGVVLFWPTLFLLEGNGPKAAEVSRLKGEMEAIEVAAKRKGCAISFKRA